MDIEQLHQRIADLEAEVAQLRAETRSTGRLGPAPETQAEIDARTTRMVKILTDAVQKEQAEGPALCTTSGEPVEQVRAEQTNDVGQHKAYIVLCPDERAKGFVRPYRDTYRHVGIRPKYATRDLTPAERERYAQFWYMAFEAYPPDAPEANGGSSTGRYWTHAQLTSGCGQITTMNRALSESYARQPNFYGSTFCVTCNRHLPVAEFIWTADGERVGS